MCRASARSSGSCSAGGRPRGRAGPHGAVRPTDRRSPGTADLRVPEHPAFPYVAVKDALFLEGAAPASRVFKGTAHLNTVVRVPGTDFPVVVRRGVADVYRRERSFLSEHAVLQAIERSNAAVAAPRVLALGESHSEDRHADVLQGPFAIHTYEGPTDLRRLPDHPVDGLLPHEADGLIDQLRALTELDYTSIDPEAGEGAFYTWLSGQLVELVGKLPEKSRRVARFLGLPDAAGLRVLLARHVRAMANPYLTLTRAPA
jgi:hypothetical protein